MLCRDAACRVSRVYGDEASPVSTDRAILLHQEILKKLTEAKSFRKGVEVVSDQRGGTENWGLGAAKDGVSIRFPVLSCRDQCAFANGDWRGLRSGSYRLSLIR